MSHFIWAVLFRIRHLHPPIFFCQIHKGDKRLIRSFSKYKSRSMLLCLAAALTELAISEEM